MQLGLWHLTLPNVRVLRSDSDEETLSLSAMLHSLWFWGWRHFVQPPEKLLLWRQFIIMNFYTRATGKVNPVLNK
jgi:hypothetical protein